MKIRLPGFTTAGYFSVGVVVWLYAGAASVVGVPRVVAAMTRKPRVRRRGCDAENSRACRICECVEAGKCNFSRRVRTVSFWSFLCGRVVSSGRRLLKRRSKDDIHFKQSRVEDPQVGFQHPNSLHSFFQTVAHCSRTKANRCIPVPPKHLSSVRFTNPFIANC